MAKAMDPALKITDEQKAKFDDTYGDDGWAHITREVDTEPGVTKWEIAFRRPTPAEFQAFKARNAKGESRATELLVRGALIHPSAAVLKEWMETGVCAAGIFDGKKVGDAVSRLLDLTADEVEK
jgi:hypothetical protein